MNFEDYEELAFDGSAQFIPDCIHEDLFTEAEEVWEKQ